MLELTIRLVFSLAVVLGLLLLLTKLGARRFAGSKDALIRVVHRQQVSRGAAVSVVAVGSRVLVLGTTEQHVSVLAELDPEEITDELGTGDVLTLVPGEDDADGATPTFVLPAIEAPAVERPRGAHRAAPAPARPARGGRRVADRPASRAATRPSEGALTGSVLSADTWRQALAAATRRAS